MTECERILSEGLFPKDFLKEEVRNNFLITEKQKKVWLIYLDLMVKFDSFCKKHNMRYFVAFGSLIGAVRHGGIIPWDCDVDVALFKDDYYKFLELAPKELPEPYFVRSIYTQKGDYYNLSRLNNSNTTCLYLSYLYDDFNRGIGLDIFSIEGISNDAAGRKLFAQLDELYSLQAAAMRQTTPQDLLTDRYKDAQKNYKGGNPEERKKLIRALREQNNLQNSDWIFTANFTTYGFDRLVQHKEDFAETVYFDFECLPFKVPAPAGYDRILRTTYGDYMKFPEKIELLLEEPGLLFDPDVPYREHVLALRQKHKNGERIM